MIAGAAVALLIACVAATFWPGVTMYDTVAQYGQVLNNHVDDWHPPIMVRLWQLLHPLRAGTAPMFTLQIVLYASGFGLIVEALARCHRPGAAFAASLLALSPLLLGWQMVVLKDAQMLGALIAATGIVVHFRLSNLRVPVVAAVLAGLLILYATLVRGNSLFATVPLAVLLLPTRNRPGKSILLAVIGIALVLGAVPIINHRLLNAEPSGVAKTQPLFDLAGIAVRTPLNAQSPYTAAERKEILDRHCVKAFFWDPMGDPGACGPITARFMTQSQGRLYLALAQAAIAHPVAYAHQRLSHWNSTERWLVAAGLPDVAPPIEAEPNGLGLGTADNDLASTWQDTAALEASTPLGWPILWTLIAVLLAVPAWRRRGEPAGDIAFALIASALTLEASFLVISIASDLRYHLWSMTASALALILLSGDFALMRRAWIGSVALLSLMLAAGLVSRASLPRAPDSYQGMIHAPSG